MQNDVIISSRVRLARNLSDFPFYAEGEDALRIAKNVSDAVKDLGHYDVHLMSNLNGNVESYSLMEKHLISPDLIKNKKSGVAIISEDKTVSIMVNEEDHLRQQCITQGFSLDEAYRKIDDLDTHLSKKLNFAFHQKLGYLTTCITNLGTGLRASVMMFLPALSMTRSLEEVVANVSRLNLTVRGVYGEGSDHEGYIYQISNQNTLGISEQEIIDAVKKAATHIRDAEIAARNSLMSSAEADL
ncbi:MAG: ATP--guanido phosphotransferase, partial [Clostridia bacterium]|nr:ATP--guanido phosphotransferase [Clostridia bacterium]